MSGLYLDAYSGISGDMMLGALLDVGVPLEHLVGRLDALGIAGWRLEAETVVQHGVSGARARVILDAAEQPARPLSDIQRLLESAALEPEVKANAIAVFKLLAEAEAGVHGGTVEEVHFHEVGAVDAIVDIVGACLGLQYLGIRECRCSPLPLGKGFVRSAHGLLPVPAPATVELLARCGAPALPDTGEGEMVTPTGAALVAHFGRFEGPAPLRPQRVGYGFGTRQMPWPNALRAILTQAADLDAYETDEVVLLECNIDDMSGEVFPFVVEELLRGGALDAWTAPIAMKKGRPATLLSVLGPREQVAPLVATLMRETSTLGVRSSTWQRYKAGRRVESVQTAYGPIAVKLKLLHGRIVAAAPEYEDCARLAREHQVSLSEVYDTARARAGDLLAHD